MPPGQRSLLRLRLVAEQGYASAQYNLGVMYYNGRGVPQDYAEAHKWFRLAAEQGNADAQHVLGMMYDKGQGVPQDDAAAIKWYRLAAEQGNASAQYNLALIYKKGEGGPQDYVQAANSPNQQSAPPAEPHYKGGGPYCVRCGGPMSAQDRYCHVCGSPSKKPKPRQPPKRDLEEGPSDVPQDAQAKWELVRELMKKRTSEDPVAKAMGFDDPALADSLSQMELAGFPEAAIVNIVESYALLRRQGATDADIFERIEGFRSSKLGSGELPNPLTLESYSLYRVRLDYDTESPGRGIVSERFVTQAVQSAREHFHIAECRMPAVLSAYTPSGEQVRPVVRFLARMLDIGIFALLVCFVSVSDSHLSGLIVEANEPLVSIVLLFAYAFVEPAMLAAWGTTPGKALLRVRLRNSDGSKLTYDNVWRRAFKVWFKGLGLGIPIVYFFTLYFAHQDLAWQGITSWDQEGNFVVNHQIVGPLRSIVTVLIFFLLAKGVETFLKMV